MVSHFLYIRSKVEQATLNKYMVYISNMDGLTNSYQHVLVILAIR